MKAIVVHEHGGPEVMKYEDVPEPDLRDGDALVGIEAAGVNFIDVNQRSGAYPVNLPFIPGSEGAGVVRAVDKAVTEVSVGDRVAFATVPNAYAELVTVNASRLVVLPDKVTTEQAAATMLQGMTAHYLVNSVCAFDDGDWCLVHASAGGVGLFLVQLAKRRGLRVIGTTSTAAKAETVRRAGADRVVVYTNEDFVSAVAETTGGGGVRAVFDSVGRETFDGSMKCLARRGYMILFGQSSGPVAPIDPRVLQQGGSLFLTRPGLVDYIAGRDLASRSHEVLSLVQVGELEVHVHDRYALADAPGAHRALESRATTGKLILIP